MCLTECDFLISKPLQSKPLLTYPNSLAEEMFFFAEEINFLGKEINFLGKEIIFLAEEINYIAEEIKLPDIKNLKP